MSRPTITHRYPLKHVVGWFLFVAFVVVILLAIFSVAHAEKSDGECTGLETAGRCADKCPEGYYQQGMDKETGAAVCHLNATPPAPVKQVDEQPPITQADIDANIAAEGDPAAWGK